MHLDDFVGLLIFGLLSFALFCSNLIIGVR
jgi:hypothetical protein